MLDMQADQLSTIVGSLICLFLLNVFFSLENLDMILDDLMANKTLLPEKRCIIRNSLLLKHIHQVC